MIERHYPNSNAPLQPWCKSSDVTALEQAAAQMSEALELHVEQRRAVFSNDAILSESLHKSFVEKRNAALAAYREATK